VVTQGVDAQITVGTGPGKYSVTSSTNTFSGVMADTTFTVSQKGVDAAVTVAGDPSSIAAKVKNLVDTANSLLSSISSYTDSDSTSAVLKGDTTVRGLAGRVLDVVSSAVGGQSASVVGLQVTKSGQLTFDSATFTEKLTSDPALVKDMFMQTSVLPGPDGLPGTADDAVGPVGIAAQLEALAKAATDTTNGTLVTLAAGEDARAKDLQDRIDNWDIRLDLRRKTLTRQFTAMETALSTLQNQQSWLTSQLGALPSWSKSNES
jgi:flagellar hook-associated protein 2